VALSAANNNGAVGAGGRPSVVQGYGRFEFATALYFNDTSTFKAMSVSDAQTATQDAPYRICLTTFGTSPMATLAVTLAWFDTSTTPGAGVVLVNDLDLVVYEHSTGRSWRGNDATGFDHVNTVEHVEFTPLPNANYVVIVYGTTVTTATPFSLVMTGDYGLQSCSGFTSCANGCSDPTNNDCEEGVCNCNGAQIGLDCTLLNCPSSCGEQGECDYTYGSCLCNQGYYGTGCAFAYTAVVPMEVDVTRSSSMTTGESVGLFAGLFVAVYLVGCFCAALFGIICGQKFLAWRRDRAASV